MSQNIKALYELIKLLFENPFKFNVELDSNDSILMSLLIKRISDRINYDQFYIRDFIIDHEDFEVSEENDKEYVRFIG